MTNDGLCVPVKSTSFRDFWFFFGVQFLSYAIICWNWRAIAQGRYASIFVSDMIFAGVNFLLIKRVSEAKSKAALAGYVLGGACGSLVSVWITRKLYGE
jgi:hypothetical protein